MSQGCSISWFCREKREWAACIYPPKLTLHWDNLCLSGWLSIWGRSTISFMETLAYAIFTNDFRHFLAWAELLLCWEESLWPWTSSGPELAKQGMWAFDWEWVSSRTGPPAVYGQWGRQTPPISAAGMGYSLHYRSFWGMFHKCKLKLLTDCVSYRMCLRALIWRSPEHIAICCPAKDCWVSAIFQDVYKEMAVPCNCICL